MKWMNILKNEEFGPCEKQLITAYKDHMTEDYTHPSLEKFRKLSDMYMSCIIKVGKHPV